MDFSSLKKCVGATKILICQWKNLLTGFYQEKTKRENLVKFLLVLTALVAYLVFTSISLGIKNGLWTTILTWSFFVFCTPIADAGFLLDFPIRVITKIRMVYSEAAVWGLAFTANIFTLLVNPEIYTKTIILSLFYKIISQPFPFWGIILLSAIGTFFSIYFGDELMDVSSHAHRKKYHAHSLKHQLIIFAFIIVLIILLYDFLLTRLGIDIPL